MKYKVGDKVIKLGNSGGLKKGETATVTSTTNNSYIVVNDKRTVIIPQNVVKRFENETEIVSNKFDKHYQGTIQPIKLMESQMTHEAFMGYLRGNIIKYCSRFGKKKNADITDEARKIQKYAEWLYEVAKGEEITV